MPDAPDAGARNAGIDNINRLLKRAEKLAGPDLEDNEVQVQFNLESARILALLEVAAALRNE